MQDNTAYELEMQRKLIMDLAKSRALKELEAISTIKGCIAQSQGKAYFKDLLEQIDPFVNRRLMGDLDREPLKRLTCGIHEYIIMKTPIKRKANA